MSPLAVLARGYAVVTGPDGSVIVNAADVNPGDELTARDAQGHFRVRVIS